MGNSRSSHNFSKSSRSVSIGDLPYKLGSTSYASKQGSRPLSVASTLPRQTKEKPTTKRSTSLGSLNDKNKPSSVIEKPVVKRTSTASLIKQRPTTVDDKPTTRRYPDPPAGPRQFNDNFLQPDVKKLFKVNDKRNSQALVTNMEENSTKSLDEKLATLKKQRAGVDETDNAKTKKSRKVKKAPSLPPNTKSNTVPENVTPPKTSVTNGLSKVKTPQRKKSAAPAPPNKPIQEMATASNNQLNDSNNNNRQQQLENISKAPNSENDKQSNQPTSAGSEEHKLGSEQADSVPLSLHRISPETEPVTATDRELRSTTSHSNPVAPTVSPNSSEVIHAAKPKTVIEREIFSTKKSPDSRKRSKAPLTPSASILPSTPVDRVCETDHQLQIHTTDEDTFIEAITKQAMESEKVERKEVEIHCSTRVDIEIQCDSDQMLQDEPENTGKAGDILKLFIDKNAHDDAKRSPDERTPISSAEPAASKGISQTETDDTQTNINTLSPLNDGTSITSRPSENKSVGSAIKVEELQSQADSQCHSSDNESQHDQPPQTLETNTENQKDESNFGKSTEELTERLVIEEKPQEHVNTKSDVGNTTEHEVGDNTELEIRDNTKIEICENTEHGVGDKEVDQSNCASPSYITNHDEGVEVIDIFPAACTPIDLPQLRGEPEEPLVVDNGKSQEIEKVNEASDAAASSSKICTNKDHESSDLIGDEVSASELRLDLQTPFPVKEFSSDTPVSATRFPATDNLAPDTTDGSKETKKHKSRFSGIFRITKTMRRFMSSVGKSPKPHKEEDKELSQDEAPFSTDNWMLAADGDRKPTPRKVYKPTRNDETYESSEATLNLDDLPINELDEKAKNMADEKQTNVNMSEQNAISTEQDSSLEHFDNWTLKDKSTEPSTHEVNHTETNQDPALNPQPADDKLSKDDNETVPVEDDRVVPNCKAESEEVEGQMSDKIAPPTNDLQSLEQDANDDSSLAKENNSMTTETVQETLNISEVTAGEISVKTTIADLDAVETEQETKRNDLSNDKAAKQNVEVVETVPEAAVDDIVTVETSQHTINKDTSRVDTVEETQPGISPAQNFELKSAKDNIAAAEAAQDSVELVSSQNATGRDGATAANDDIIIMRKKPAMNSKDVPRGSAATIGKNAHADRDTTLTPSKRSSSTLALMTPKAYGSTSSVYRPVSQLLPTHPTS